MKKRIIGTLSALALVLGIGVATATAAHASTWMGPFKTGAACYQSQTAYSNAGYQIVSPCETYRVNQSNTFVWKYRVLIRY